MAKVKPRKTAGKPPITRHPLFPATVALWFGALFGIGSLAIRPTLIDQFIVSLGIDAIIPAVAPPLGATTRILLALAMAAMGGTLGAWLARRMGRPKVVPVQRKRSAGKVGATPAKDSTNIPARSSRRGRPALGEEAKPRSDYVERAPVPGGASILDVSQFDLDGFEAENRDEIDEFRPDESYEPENSVDCAALATKEFASHIPEGAQVFQPLPADQPAAPEPEAHEEPRLASPSEPSREFSVASSKMREEAHDVPPVDETVADRSIPTAVSSVEAGPVPFSLSQEHAPFAPPADHQRFEPEAETMPFSPPQIEKTANQEEPSLAEDCPATAPYRSEVAEQVEQESSPLQRLGDEGQDRFEPLPPKARPGSIFETKPVTGLFTQQHNTRVAHVGWNNGSGEATDAEAEGAFANEPETAEDSIEQAAETVPAAEDRRAWERIAAAPLDELSHVELLERLALSMLRKRVHEQPGITLETESATESSVPVPHEPAPAPPIETADAETPPPVPTVPDALRPIGLDEDDDSDLLPALIPHRHFGQMQDDSTAVPQTQDDPVTEEAHNPQQAPDTPVAEDLQQGYSSLLNLSRPGAGPQRFVRIEEEKPLSAEIEPVVIFPGKETVSSDRPFSRPADKPDAPTGEQDEAELDHPSASPASRQDPEETDRALRSALANLQRMSGAA